MKADVKLLEVAKEWFGERDGELKEAMGDGEGEG